MSDPTGADFLASERPGKSDKSDEHDEGSRVDLVHQDPIMSPSREVPMHGGAVKIRFDRSGLALTSHG
jgi:hypothetical protein